MGAKAREARRAAERLRKEVEANQVRAAVVVSPTSDLSLEDVTALVRPALLYADRVVLHSPKTSMLAAMAALPAVSENPALDLLLALDDTTLSQIGGDPLVVRKVRAALEQGGPSRALVDGVLSAVTATANKQLGDAVQTTLSEAGVGELEPALDAGLLEIAMPTSWEGDTLIEEFLAAIGQVLANPRLLPMFDAGAADLTTAALREGLLDPASNRPGGYAGAATGAGLLAMLPSFPNATTREVLDIRRDLERPLAAYRQAVAGLTTKLATQPWEPTFGAELDELWRTDVQPALDDLTERLAETSFLRQLGPRLVKPMDLLRTGAITWMASSLTTRADKVTLAAGVGTLTAGAVAGAVRDIQTRSRDIKGSGLWIVHAVEQRLGQ